MWFKVDDSLAFNPKVIEAGNSAIGLWVRAGAWSGQHLTNGFVPSAVVRRLGGRHLVPRLIAAGLWHEVDGGYQFHDWARYQPTKADALEGRAKARERKARSRAHLRIVE